MTNRVVERVNDLGDRARERRMETRLDKVDRENDRLKGEVKLLRDDLHEERGSLQQALDALKAQETVTVVKKPRRTSRLLRTAVIGGGAYLLGTRAGRERYDQIMARVNSAKSGVKDRMGQGSADDGWDTGASPTVPGSTS